MDISSATNTVTITGNIKSVNDFQSIKSTIDSLKDVNSTITLDIQDSIDLNTKIGDAQLMHLLEDLNLTATFKAKRR